MSSEQAETTELIPPQLLQQQQQQGGHQQQQQLPTQQDRVPASGDGSSAAVKGIIDENSSSMKDYTSQQHGNGGPNRLGDRTTAVAPTMSMVPSHLPPPPPPPYGLYNPWPQPPTQDHQQQSQEEGNQRQQSEPAMNFGHPQQSFMNGSYWPSYSVYPPSHAGGAAALPGAGPEGVSYSAPAVPPTDNAAGQYVQGQLFPSIPPPQYPPYPPAAYHMPMQHQVHQMQQPYQHHHAMMMMTHLPTPQGPPLNLSDDDMKELIKDSDLVLISDRNLVGDILLISFGQLKPIVITEKDRFSYYKDRPDGFVGLGCIHCGGFAGSAGYGRYFPASVRSLAQTTTAQTVTNHMSKKCLKCPKEIRETILMLQRQETYCQQMMAMTGKSRSSQANPLETRNESSKWGKRKVFFQCLWDRLHKITPKPTNKSAEKSKKEHENNPSAHEKKTPTKIKEEGDQIDYEKGPSVAHDLSKNDGTVNDTDRGTLHANTTNKDERDKEEAITESSKGDDKPSSGKRKRSDEGEIAAAV